jgi:hypothetical protein
MLVFEFEFFFGEPVSTRFIFGEPVGVRVIFGNPVTARIILGMPAVAQTFGNADHRKNHLGMRKHYAAKNRPSLCIKDFISGLCPS